MKTFGEVCYGEAAVQVLQSNYAPVHNAGLNTLYPVLSPKYINYLSIPNGSC